MKRSPDLDGWAGDPFADQRAFAKAGGSRDESQLAIQYIIQPPEQALSGNNFRMRWGNIQLCAQDLRSHTSIIKHVPQKRLNPLAPYNKSVLHTPSLDDASFTSSLTD